MGRQQSNGRVSCRNFENLKLEDLVIEPVLGDGEKNCSFGRDEIIPLLRIYDPASAKEKLVEGRKLITYSGTFVVLCPKSQEAKFKSLRRGELIDETQGSEGVSP